MSGLPDRHSEQWIFKAIVNTQFAALLAGRDSHASAGLLAFFS